MRISLVTLFILLIGCHLKTEKAELPNEESPLPIAATDTIPVKIYTAEVEPLVYPVKTIGKVRSSQRSTLIFERSGIVSDIHVSNGSTIRKGQVIAILKNDKELLQKQRAEIELKRALVNFENEMLALGDSLYYQEKWPTVKENVQLNTGVLAAKVALREANLALSQTIVLAPQKGIIEGLDLKPGDYVSANRRFATLYDPGQFEVAGEVLEYDAVRIQPGTMANVYPLATGDTLTGTVSEINPSINEKGLARVILKLHDSPKVLPGLSTRVVINVAEQPTIVIPLKAVVKRSERHVVFNLAEGRAKWNYVTLGKDNGEYVQILEGLEEGMQVIVSNNLQLAHDSPVRVE